MSEKPSVASRIGTMSTWEMPDFGENTHHSGEHMIDKHSNMEPSDTNTNLKVEILAKPGTTLI